MGKKKKHPLFVWFEYEWQRDHADSVIRPSAWAYEIPEGYFLSVVADRTLKSRTVYRWSFNYWGDSGESDTLEDAMKSAESMYQYYFLWNEEED